LLYGNTKTKRYGTNILSVVLNGCEAWYVTPREKYKIKDFDNSELRTVFRPKSYEVTGVVEDYITRSFMICTPHKILFGRSNQNDRDGRCMWHVCETGELHTGFGGEI
jgi:hypothetical protein